MLMGPPPTRLIIREDGFTLVELLVAMVTSLAIVLVLFTMLQVTTGQTTLITDKVQANRLGRQTMTDISDELHSACFAREYAPVQEKSSGTELIFANAYTEAPEIKTPAASKVASEGVHEHKIKFNAGGKIGQGTLVDTTYPSTTAELPTNVLFSSTKEREVRVGEHLAQVEVGKEKAPIFKYYQYKKTAGVATGNAPATTLEEIPLKEGELLKSPTVEKVAAVVINFDQLPIDNKNELHQGLEMESQVTLALGSPTAENPIQDEPCE
jgi:Tfp pilus assembly protein PilW